MSHTNIENPQPLIFTDMDGTLLDHHTYSFEPAVPLLQRLQQHDVPVICCTSKTYAELLTLRAELENSHPFIVENGAAIYLPEAFVNALPGDERASLQAAACPEMDKDGFCCYAFSETREHWLALLESLKPEFGDHFTHFAAMGDEGVGNATGLPVDQARQASLREFGEPIQWLGDQESKTKFIKRLEQSGATVLQGGRFMHACGASDKGGALKWLADCYRKRLKKAVTCLALGDSGNDIAMLEQADCAVVVRSPVHAPPEINNPRCYVSQQCGPLGWVEGVTHFLTDYK